MKTKPVLHKTNSIFQNIIVVANTSN